MEHARKMILVPSEAFARFQNRSSDGLLNSVQTPGTSVSRLDAEMSDILNSGNTVDEREQCMRYCRALQRYLHFKDVDSKYKIDNFDDERKNIGHVPDGKDEDINDCEKRVNEIERDREVQKDSHVIQSVPQKFRARAAGLLRHLRTNGRITWNANGTTFIDGVLIPKANIVDLVNDAMRNRKNHQPPPGNRQFAHVLRCETIPREYIGNTRILQLLDNSSPSSSSTRSFGESPHSGDGSKETGNSFKSISSSEELCDRVSRNRIRKTLKRKINTPHSQQIKKWVKMTTKLKK